MAARNYLVQCTLQSDTALPEDDVVNTWAIQDPDDSHDPADALTAFENFYLAIDGSLSSTLSGVLGVDIYDRSDPTPRVPVESSSTSGLTLATTTLPREVALCLSFRGDLVSGQNPRRRRGRVYLGPLGQSNTTDDQGDLRPNSTLINLWLTSYQALVTALNADGFYLGVWSEAAGAFTITTLSWVDNAFDTQRRRGRIPTARTSDATPQVVV